MAYQPKSSQSPPPSFEHDIYDASPQPRASARPQRSSRAHSGRNSPSTSPAVSLSSDEENSARLIQEKGKRRQVPTRRVSPTPPSDEESVGAGKRKRSENRDGDRANSRRRLTVEPQDDEEDSDLYDPDQAMEERRKVRNQYRNLHQEVNDNRLEYLKPDSTGLLDALLSANSISKTVKQTTDATLDSRLLVTVGDLSYKKTVQLTIGESVEGVDVDEFVRKCISFMKYGVVAIPDGTQARNNAQRRLRGEDGDDSDVDDGDEKNWDHLGRMLCLQHNARPAVSGFLLGPLSLEKKARKVTQRRAGFKLSSLKETQPEVISAADIQKADNTNLTVVCTDVLRIMRKKQDSQPKAVEAEAPDDADPDEVKGLMLKHGVHESGALDYYRFVVNPFSFGQTVENMFYVSFLIRDGKAGIEMSEDGLTGLSATEPRTREEAKGGAMKHQAVFELTQGLWRDLIKVYNITEPMIPHREAGDPQPEGQARAWIS